MVKAGVLSLTAFSYHMPPVTTKSSTGLMAYHALRGIRLKINIDKVSNSKKNRNLTLFTLSRAREELLFTRSIIVLRFFLRHHRED
jgi:hypothetical protein